MQKIGNITSTADVNGEWTNGNVAAGTTPTILDAAWLNTVQRELANIVTSSGLNLDPNDDTQVMAALKKMLQKGRLLNVRAITTSGTYTPTPGTTSILVEAVGGGASGANCASTSATTFGAAGGGGSGTYVKALFNTLPSTVAVTIGSGGNGAAPGANAGNPGGQTTFGSLLTAPGGTASIAGFIGTTITGSSGSVNGSPGTVTGDTVITNLPGMAGGPAFSLNTTLNISGLGGSNPLGTGGWAGIAGGGGRPASGYGSGSGGVNQPANTTSVTGISGQPGAVIVYEYS